MSTGFRYTWLKNMRAIQILINTEIVLYIAFVLVCLSIKLTANYLMYIYYLFTTIFQTRCDQVLLPCWWGDFDSDRSLEVVHTWNTVNCFHSCERLEVNRRPRCDFLYPTIELIKMVWHGWLLDIYFEILDCQCLPIEFLCQ